MKKIFLMCAIAFTMTLSTLAANQEQAETLKTRVHIFQTSVESVDVYVRKEPGQLVKVLITSQKGIPLMKTRIKKQDARYLRYYLNELPQGTYKVKVLQDGEIISEMELNN